MAKEPGGSSKQNFGNNHDGGLAVWIGPDRFEAYADFHPPSSTADPVKLSDVRQWIEKANVKFGLKLDIIKEALDDCNERRVPLYEVVIAKGSLPENEILEYYEKAADLGKKNWEEKDGERVDYKTRSPFTIVRKDQILAELNPKRIGKLGRNIYGDTLPFKVERPESVIGGENTRVEDGKILSNIDGLFVQAKKVLNVQDTLVIKGSVGYGTGNIVFPGDVVIAGEVADGFKIHSGGTIKVNQTFDVTEAVAKQNILAAGGIIGRGIGVLKAGGQIKAKFIANCRAAAKGPVTVEREISNSSIYTFDRLETTEKGAILGCRVYCVRGLKTGRIGRQISRSTHIYCGIDFVVQKELEKCNGHLQDLASRADKLKIMLEAPDIKAKKQAKITEYMAKIEKEQAKTNAKISALLPKVNVDFYAEVHVLGELARGTIIEICQTPFLVEKALTKVRVKLDLKNRKIVSEPL